ncbi:MAG: SurA N-terminal domain-containing protein [Helicobacteraceae bacterium]|jgi:parvulin-like peptidyl-prolyl isomerase|nr:SurA N-terminal domain-containing protein [Helicobacteraceae bacterium]
MKTLLICLCAAIALWAQTINAVCAVVLDKAITLYEVENAAKAGGIGKEEALNRLIDLRLREAKIDELGLSVDEDEIDLRLEQIAKRSNMNVKGLREALSARGVNYQEYRENVKKAILNEKLSSAVLSSEAIPIGEEEVERYYNQNRAKFTAPSEIAVIQYASRNERSLRAVMQNPMLNLPDVTQMAQTLSAQELNPVLYATLSATDIGRFTAIFPAGDRLVTLLVRSKKGSVQRSLQDVRLEIYEELRREYEERSIANYFAKERARTEVVILREIK